MRAVADESKDAELAQVARLRVARLLIQQGKHDEALKLLDVEKAGAFAAQVHEIRGDAQVAKGDRDSGARAEYAAALAADVDGADRSPDRRTEAAGRRRRSCRRRGADRCAAHQPQG